ncbi:hypothetical protein ACFWY5_56515 [Nonomuraea sp. NPDC059007]
MSAPQITDLFTTADRDVFLAGLSTDGPRKDGPSVSGGLQLADHPAG